MAILAVIILVYHNPLANPQDELLKKSDCLRADRGGGHCLYPVIR